MPANKTCGQCATEIPASAAQGLCPRCLLASGLQLIPDITSHFTNSARAGAKATGSSRSADYEMLGEIARGGMGLVFKARQLSLNRIVAVKALLFAEFASDDFVDRFRREAQSAGGLQHPNIVGIHEVWEHAGQHFFSMEYVPGATLAQVLRDGPLSWRRAAQYTETIARALEYAHSKGVLHRDLKPSNILLDHSDQPRITDFGLAKRLGRDESPTATVEVMGSPNYMPPEQIKRGIGEVGPRSDIYSLGATLYQMLTGRPPTIGETIEEILANALQSEPPSPRELNPNVPRDLETICFKCLQKEPSLRYASARDVADDLARLLRNEPICARPVSRVEKTIRWCRRKPAAALAIALLVAVAVGSLGVSVHLGSLNEEARIQSYVSDMNIAFRHMDEGDTAHVFEILKTHIPRRGETDLRGFEWRHLWSLCRGNYAHSLPVHPQVVGAIQISTNGRAATYAWNKIVRVWDAEKQNLITLPNVSALGGFSSDEQSLIVSRTNGALQFIEVATGKTNREIANAGELLAFANKAQIAVTMELDHRLKIRNLAERSDTVFDAKVLQPQTEFGWRSPVAISANGSKIALIAASANPFLPAWGIRVWEYPSGKEISSLLQGHEYRCLTFSPDGNWLAAGDGDGKLHLLNFATGQKQTIDAHKTPILSLAYSPGGEILATGAADDHSVRLLDGLTGLPLEAEIRGQVGDVWSLAFTADGKNLASGTRDGLIRVWNLDALKPQPPLDKLHADKYANVAFSPDGKLFAGGCMDNTVKIWNTATLELVAKINRATFVVAFSPDGERILVSTQSGDPFWWNLKSGSAQKIPGFYGTVSDMVSVDISRDRRTAAIGMMNGEILMLDLSSGKQIGPTLLGHNGPVRSVAFDHTGEKLASGGSDKNVMMWNWKTGQSLGVCQEHKGGVFGVTISPSGKTLASGCGAETIKLWDAKHVTKGAWASTSYHKSAIRSLSFAPDERTLASGSEDRTVKLWNFSAFAKSRSRREVASFTFDAPLRAVLFAPDGNTLAAVTDKGAVRLFHAASLDQIDSELR